MREAWIKAKYVTKSFINRISIPNPGAQTHAVAARRWSVRKRKRKPQDGKTNEKAPPATSALSDSPEKGVASAGGFQASETFFRFLKIFSLNDFQ